MKAHTSPRRLPRLLVAALVAVVATIAAAVAIAADPQPAIQTSTPKSENQITNIDVLRQQIRNYYGDPLGTGTFGSDSNYANEASSAAAAGARWLQARAHAVRGQKAIVLDVDDTTRATWNYEIFSNWAFNPTTNATFVLNQAFPAVPGMVQMVNGAASEGYAIFFL
ncbi:MAG TPA: HAD family acid phosphatase, partial [Gaiella sp.]|nr:HAD family acid phosphatase [Gaiella sp.]